jgi:hypothetical protein
MDRPSWRYFTIDDLINLAQTKLRSRRGRLVIMAFCALLAGAVIVAPGTFRSQPKPTSSPAPIPIDTVAVPTTAPQSVTTRTEPKVIKTRSTTPTTRAPSPAATAPAPSVAAVSVAPNPTLPAAPPPTTPVTTKTVAPPDTGVVVRPTPTTKKATSVSPTTSGP